MSNAIIFCRLPLKLEGEETAIVFEDVTVIGPTWAPPNSIQLTQGESVTDANLSLRIDVCMNDVSVSQIAYMKLLCLNYLERVIYRLCVWTMFHVYGLCFM